MKNKIYLTLNIVSVLLVGNVKAQYNNYQFSKQSTSFQYLVNPKHILFDTLWYGKSYLNSLYGQPNIKPLLPFYEDSFPYWNLNLKQGGMDVYNVSLNHNLGITICRCRMREINKLPPYESEVNYQFDSIKKSHQFEFKNIGLIDSTDNVVGKLNLQLKLYINGVIEYHFGNNQFSPFAIPNKKFFDFGWVYWRQTDTSADAYVNILTGEPNNPTYLQLERLEYNEMAKLDKVHINGFPNEGTVYSFAPPAVGLQEKVKNNSPISVFPNPAQSFVSIELPEDVSVKSILGFDLKGERFFIRYNQHEKKADVSELPNGLYMLEIKTNKGVVYTKSLVYR